MKPQNKEHVIKCYIGKYPVKEIRLQEIWILNCYAKCYDTHIWFGVTDTNVNMFTNQLTHMFPVIN